LADPLTGEVIDSVLQCLTNGILDFYYDILITKLLRKLQMKLYQIYAQW